MKRYSFLWIIKNKTGGGSKPTPPTIIQAPNPPSVADTAKQSAEAQLQYNPQLTAQSVQLQGQYGPELASQQYNVQAQFAPLYRALIEKQFPQISTLATQTQEGLANPRGLSNEQQAAQDAIRQRALEASARGERTRANLGGTLYGGNSALNESRARNELLQGFTNEDITRQQQQRQQTMQELLSLFQLAGFNVQQPSVPQFGSAPAASGDALYNAMVQNQGNFGVIPGTQGSPSPGWGLAGSLGGAGLVGGAILL